MNGFEDIVEEDTMVLIEGSIDTMAGEFELEQVVDLCKLNNKMPTDDDADDKTWNYNTTWNYNSTVDDAYYGDDAYAADDATANGDDYYNAANGDDANGDDGANANGDDGANANGDDYYNNNANGDDANGDDGANANGDDYYNRKLEEDEDDDAYVEGCPADGIYDFTAYLTLPNGKWRGSGWGATGNFDVYARGAKLVGSCKMEFATPTTAWYILPASSVVRFWMLVGACALFYGVYYMIKKQMLCNARMLCSHPCHRLPSEDPDDAKGYKNMDGDLTDDSERDSESEGEGIHDRGMLRDQDEKQKMTPRPWQSGGGLLSKVRESNVLSRVRKEPRPVMQQHARPGSNVLPSMTRASVAGLRQYDPSESIKGIMS